MSLNNPNLPICRVCMIQHGSLQSIFTTEDFAERSLQINEVISICASVQVELGDGLPQEICAECLRRLREAYAFKNLCEHTDSTLRNLISDIKLEKEEAHVDFDPDLYVENAVEKQEAAEQKEHEDDVSLFHMDSYEDKELQAEPEASDANRPFIDDEIHEEIYSESYIKQLDNTENKEEPTTDLQPEHDNNKTDSANSNVLVASNFALLVYPCRICSEVFIDQTKLEIHVRQHEVQKSSEINENATNSDVDDDLNEQLNAVKQGEIEFLQLDAAILDSYECEICHDKFPLMAMLENHKRTHDYLNENAKEKSTVEDAVTHECSVCFETFPTLFTMTKHQENTHKELYGKITRKQVEVAQCHKKTTYYECNICRRVFLEKSKLDNHKKAGHPNLVQKKGKNKFFECPHCEATFDRRSIMWWHRKHRHEHKQCGICGKSILLEDFDEHKSTHKKDFECELCSRKFYTPKSLHSHIKTVHPDKPKDKNVCHHCGKICGNLQSLSMHVQEHENTNECELCGTRFSRKYRLRIHMKAHEKRDESKPYTCDVCEEGFSANTSLWRHKKRFHPKKPKEERPNYFTEDYFKQKTK